MSQEQHDKLSIEQLVAIAKEPSKHPDISVSPRVLQSIETFIQDTGLENGQRKIHNLIVYDVYRNWSKGNALTLVQFFKTFSLYFPKVKAASNNIAFKLKLKYRGGKFDTSTKNLKHCRELYGRKKTKKEVVTITNETRESKTETEQG